MPAVGPRQQRETEKEQHISNTYGLYVKTLRSEMEISLSHHHWHCWLQTCPTTTVSRGNRNRFLR